MSRAGRDVCVVCEKSMRLRVGGRLMQHRAEVWDGYAPPVGCVIGTVVCAGSGLVPGGEEILTVPQRCGWCGGDRPNHGSNDCRDHPNKGPN